MVAVPQICTCLNDRTIHTHFICHMVLLFIMLWSLRGNHWGKLDERHMGPLCTSFATFCGSVVFQNKTFKKANTDPYREKDKEENAYSVRPVNFECFIEI